MANDHWGFIDPREAKSRHLSFEQESRRRLEERWESNRSDERRNDDHKDQREAPKPR